MQVKLYFTLIIYALVLQLDLQRLMLSIQRTAAVLHQRVCSKFDVSKSRFLLIFSTQGTSYYINGLMCKFSSRTVVFWASYSKSLFARSNGGKLHARLT
jgi:hypothetical protein